MTVQKQDRIAEPTQRSVDFTTIVLSLRHVALLSLSMVEDDSVEDFPPDAEACRMQIDMLEVLKEKTVGNLSEDENKLLDSVLYELRMAFVQYCESTRAAKIAEKEAAKETAKTGA